MGPPLARVRSEPEIDVFDYRAQLEQYQIVRSMKFPLDAHNTEASAAVDASILIEPNEERQTEGTAEGSEHNSWLGHTQAGVGRPTISSRGRTLTPNVRNVNLVA